MTKYRVSYRVVFAGLALWLAMSSPASALGIGAAPCPDNGDSMTTLAVTCVRNAIEVVTVQFAEEVATALEDYVWAFITLTVSFFGVRLMMGEGEMQKKAFSMLIKIGVVWWLAIDLGAGIGVGLVGNVFNIMTELQQWVTNSMAVSMLFSTTCPFTVATAEAALVNSVVWSQLDCLLVKLFGFGDAGGGGTVLMASAVIGIVSSALFSGSMGVLVFFLGVATLLTILFFVFRAVYVYVSSYMYVAFLLVITPLIAPTLLLGVSQSAFMLWMRAIMSGMAQPAMLFAYLTFALPLLSFVVLDPGNPLSLFSIMPEQETVDAHRVEEQKCQWSIGTDEEFYQQLGAGAGWSQGPLRNILSPMMSGQTDLCAMFDFNYLDYEDKHSEKMLEIATSFFVAVFVAWLLKAILDKISSMTAVIFGAYSSASAVGGGSRIEQMAKSNLSMMKSKMDGMVGQSNGVGGFVKSAAAGVAGR